VLALASMMSLTVCRNRSPYFFLPSVPEMIIRPLFGSLSLGRMSVSDGEALSGCDRAASLPADWLPRLR
jgi:hypothetical protein